MDHRKTTIIGNGIHSHTLSTMLINRPVHRSVVEFQKRNVAVLLHHSPGGCGIGVIDPHGDGIKFPEAAFLRYNEPIFSACFEEPDGRVSHIVPDTSSLVATHAHGYVSLRPSTSIHAGEYGQRVRVVSAGVVRNTRHRSL